MKNQPSDIKSTNTNNSLPCCPPPPLPSSRILRILPRSRRPPTRRIPRRQRIEPQTRPQAPARHIRIAHPLHISKHLPRRRSAPGIGTCEEARGAETAETEEAERAVRVRGGRVGEAGDGAVVCGRGVGLREGEGAGGEDVEALAAGDLGVLC